MSGFAIGDNVGCLNGKGTEEALVPGWNYRVIDIDPMTGALHVRDRLHQEGAETKVYWKASRFGVEHSRGKNKAEAN